MPITIAVLKEDQQHECRVALVPQFVKLGCQVTLEAGASDSIKLPDSAYVGVPAIADNTLVESFLYIFNVGAATRPFLPPISLSRWWRCWGPSTRCFMPTIARWSMVTPLPCWSR